MFKLAAILGLVLGFSTANVRAEASQIIGRAEVVKVTNAVSIRLVSDPIQESDLFQNILIINPRLEISDSQGVISEVGVAGLGICSLFGYKGDRGIQITLPYTYTDEEARYLIYESGKVRQISRSTSLRTIKTARCQKN